MDEAGQAEILVEELSREILDGLLVGNPDADGAKSDVRLRADLGLLPVFSDERPLLGLAGFVDWRSSGRLTGLLRSGLCTARLGESVLLPGRSTLPVDRIVLFGLGESGSFDAARAAQVGGDLVELARDMSATQVILAVPSVLTQREVTEALLFAVAERLAEPRPTPQAEPEREAAQEDPAAPSESPAAAAPGDDPGVGTTAAEDEAAVAHAQPPAATEAGADDGARAVLRPPAERWWAVAEPRLVPRLRRLLSGPPRAADEGGT